MLEPLPSPISARPSSFSSPTVELTVHSPQPTGPSVSPVRLSWDSSKKVEFFPGKPNTSRPIPLPQHASQSPSPRIKIPSNRSLRLPGPNSPVTSSPEDSGFHLRYRYMSHPVGASSQSPSKVTPPPEFPPSPVSLCNRNLDRVLSRGLLCPTLPPPIQIPHRWSPRSYPNSARTSSSEESDFYPRYQHMGQPSPRVPLSPGRRRVTPPKTCPPDVPLPPIPADEQDADSKSGMLKQTLPDEQPSTPVLCTALHPFTPARPLPIQPVPSPVPGSEESEPTDTFNRNSLRQNWQELNGELPSDDIVREDSPLYVFNDDHACRTGIGPPPPYVDQLDTYSLTDMPTIGDALDRAVNVCGGSPEVRLEVSKCIGFHHGYEPPYWQTRLQACGLDAEAAKYLVDEMSKQVNWTASFGRAI
ncbi:hypothetical protein J3R82DRAFT_2919 [Butyriboletus roseoflavus]|nr:hypothetical protein J3R82DRAFT_2919 [Butyriboletus roseoflavus]